MTDKTKKILRVTYYALITVALVTVAMLLMTACVNIYRMGDFPFTRELVAEHFDRIAIPVYICLGLVVAGFILHPLLPAAEDSDKDRDRMIVQRLRRSTDLALGPAETATAIKKEQVGQKRHRLIAVVLFAAGLGVLLWYALSYDRFSMEDINGSFVGFGWMLLVCLGVPAGYGIFSLFYNRRSYRREMDLFRQMPKEAKVAVPTAKTPAWEKSVRLAVLVAAVGLIIGGWFAGGWVDVLTKAINICTECVGLG